MRILLVTGRLAEPLVRKYGKGCDVFVTPVTVAAFLTPELIVYYLKKSKINVKEYDLILIPGLVKGSAEVIEREFGVPAYKGPKNAVDIPQVLKAIKQGFKLSKIVPADELFSQDALKKVEDIRNKAKNKRYIEKALKRPGNILIGTLPVGLDFPTRIVAEIVDAPSLTIEEIMRKAKYYLREGADIIDIGMESGKTNVEFLESVLPEIKEKINAPLSLDTLNPKEIEAGEKEVDLILSVDFGTVEEILPSKPVVLIPTNMKEGKFIEDPIGRAKALEKLKEKALNLGYKGLILDPILEHYPNFSRSLVAFYLYRMRNPQDILLAGVGNITEMMDADSVGLNALLASIAGELKISLLLTTEVSPKATGSVRELKRGIDMVLLGGVKDVGINLLILKEKRRKEQKIEFAKTIIRAKKKPVKLEEVYFKIYVVGTELAVTAYKGTNPVMTIIGKEPNEIIDTILEHFSVSPRHAFYLGRELEKAYTGLKIRRSYIQEEELFGDFYFEKGL